MSCEEVWPEDTSVACDMPWAHGRQHSNAQSGAVWVTPRPISSAEMRTMTIKAIKQAIQNSDR